MECDGRGFIHVPKALGAWLKGRIPRRVFVLPSWDGYTTKNAEEAHEQGRGG